MTLNPLEAISPVDGRYRRVTAVLADYFSEAALIRYRVRVGPYKDHAKLEEARKLLLANNLDYVLLKLKVSDM